MKKIRIFAILATIIAIIALVYGSFKIYKLKKEYSEVEETYEEIQNICIDEAPPEISILQPEEDNKSNISEDSIIEEQAVKENFKVNWEELKSINQDAIAWIKIDGTNINYPIVQGTDNEEYIKRNIYGNYSKGGCIFVDMNIEKPFKALNTIIYGHNLNDGAMFNNLKKYSNEQYAKNHDEIHIYLPEEDRIYKVFAFGKINENNNKIYNTSIINLEKYYQMIQEYNQINIAENLDYSKPVIMLSTCTNSNRKERYVVVAYLSEQE